MLETIGSTQTSSALATGSAHACRILLVTTGIVTKIGINIQGTTAANCYLGLYSAGADKPASLLATTVSTGMAIVAGWQEITLSTAYYAAAGTYWIAIQVSASKSLYYQSSGFPFTPTRSYYTKTYAAFDATWLATSTQDSIVWFNMRLTINTIRGYVKATKAILITTATVVSVSFYLHAAGSFRPAIYAGTSDAPTSLSWQSGSVAGSAPAWNTVAISAGTPTALVLDAATYWLAWQWDSNLNGPSYAAGAAGVGRNFAQTYGTFPATWPASSSTTEEWSEYVTYDIVKALTDSGLGVDMVMSPDVKTLADDGVGTIMMLSPLVKALSQEMVGVEAAYRVQNQISLGSFILPHVQQIHVTEPTELDSKPVSSDLPVRIFLGKRGRTVEIEGWTDSLVALNQIREFADGSPRVLILPTGDGLSVFAVLVEDPRTEDDWAAGIHPYTLTCHERLD